MEANNMEAKPSSPRDSDRRPNTGSLYCVIREFPKSKYQPPTMFFETFGNKRHCLNYAKKAAKPNLRLCKVVPVIKWDKHGRVRGGSL